VALFSPPIAFLFIYFYYSLEFPLKNTCEGR